MSASRLRSIAVCASASAVALLVTGCAAVKVSVAPRSAGYSAAAKPWLQQAGVHGAERKLAAALEAARTTLPGALRGNEADAAAYRSAVWRVVELEKKHQWQLQPDATNTAVRSLQIVRQGRAVLDPAAPDTLLPADRLVIRGLRERTQEEGLGLPVAAWFRHDSPFLSGEPGIPPAGMAIPATAVLTFDRTGEAKLQFVRTLQRDTMKVGGRDRTLATDFSAPLALIIAKGNNRTLDLVSLILPMAHLHRMGLYQLQPYEPGKIPVVLVHGLMSRPETWRQAVNQMLADPEIRRNYQFWFYLYPTGLPVWKSAAGLRSELDRFNTELAPRARTAGERARMNRKILVGHSMGGLISSLQIREGGKNLWRQFSDKDFADLPLPDRTRKRLEQLTAFSPRTDVSRVVFVAVPHRGSPIAVRPTVSLFASLIRFAIPEIQAHRRILIMKARGDVRRDLAVPANSIRFLRENSPFLLAILGLPRDARVPIHSIIGDRGRNDAPRGGDGIVPYSSAHYPGAASEKIVPSGHDAHEHPRGIREIMRILREAL